jgi:hypothetical protein
MFDLNSKLKTTLATLMNKMGQQVNQPLIEQEMRSLRAEIRTTMPDNPVLKGARIYAQCDEDGIMMEILSRVSRTVPMSRSVIEFGASDGLENMTHALIFCGYRGYWIEGSPAKVEFIEQQLGGKDFADLRVVQKFVSLENTDEIAKGAAAFAGTADIDLLSMDLDGNDVHILERLMKTLSPKVIAAEYNGKFPPPLSLTITYNAQHSWGGDDYYGASIQKLVDVLTGYTLVCCNLSGVNSFFVRNDLLKGFTAYPIEQLYQPPRHYLTDIRRGHRSSLKYLRGYLQERSKPKPVDPAA